MSQRATVGVVGDTHGHLQLATCVVARWQKELGIRLEALFLCGDVGTFTDDAQLDSATRRHASGATATPAASARPRPPARTAAAWSSHSATSLSRAAGPTPTTPARTAGPWPP